MPRRVSQEDIDTDHDAVSKTADRLGLKGRDRDRYVHQHMTGLGYKAEARYVPGDDDDDDDDDDDRFVPRSSRNRNSGRSRRNRGRDDFI